MPLVRRRKGARRFRFLLDAGQAASLSARGRSWSRFCCVDFGTLGELAIHFAPLETLILPRHERHAVRAFGGLWGNCKCCTFPKGVDVLPKLDATRLSREH